MAKEPLYPHVPKKKAPLFPHVPKGQGGESGPERKEPWQIPVTGLSSEDERQVVFLAIDRGEYVPDEVIESLGGYLSDARFSRARLGHLAHWRKQAAAGKHVPAQVLADYPDLSIPIWREDVKIVLMETLVSTGGGFRAFHKATQEQLADFHSPEWEGITEEEALDHLEAIGRIGPASTVGGSGSGPPRRLKLYQRGPDGYPLGADKRLREGYGPIPDPDQPFQSKKGWEKPAEIYGWQWSDTFHRWTAFVRFPDGSETWTYPQHRAEGSLHQYLAKTEGDPISKYCCSICDKCVPEELLEEGRFLDRITWLREHYEKKHPGKWGEMTPMTIAGGEMVSTEYRDLLEMVDEPLPPDAY